MQEVQDGHDDSIDVSEKHLNFDDFTLLNQALKGKGRLRQVPINDATLVQHLEIRFKFSSGAGLDENEEDLGSEMEYISLTFGL